MAPALPSKTPTHPASLLALDAALQQRLFRVPSQTLYSSPGGQSLSRRPAKRVAQAQTGLQQGLVPVCSSSQPEPLSLPEGKLCVTGSPAPVPGPRTRGSTGASRAPVQLLAVASPRALASTRSLTTPSRTSLAGMLLQAACQPSAQASQPLLRHQHGTNLTPHLVQTVPATLAGPPV